VLYAQNGDSIVTVGSATSHVVVAVRPGLSRALIVSRLGMAAVADGFTGGR